MITRSVWPVVYFQHWKPSPVQLTGASCAPPFMASGCPGNPINVALDLDLYPITQQEITNYIVFGNFNYHLTDKITINAGIRWTDEEKEFSPFNTKNKLRSGYYTYRHECKG